MTLTMLLSELSLLNSEILVNCLCIFNLNYTGIFGYTKQRHKPDNLSCIIHYESLPHLWKMAVWVIIVK